MKSGKNYILLIILVSLCSIHTNAHEVPANNHWKRKFEKIWRENSTNKAIREVATQKEFTLQDLNTFIFIHANELQKDRNWFFNNAFTSDTTDVYAQQIENVLIEKRKNYLEWATEFQKVKATNAQTYTNWVAQATTPPPTPTPPAAMCDNVDFENSANPVQNWTFWLGYACEMDESNLLGCNAFSSVVYPPVSPLDPDRLVVETGGNDPFVGSLLPKVAPGGTKSFRLENRVNGANAAKASITFTVDPSKPYYKYKYAVVLEDPGGDHPKEAKPFFLVRIYNAANEEITCGRYYVSANSNKDNEDPVFAHEFVEVTPGSAIKYKRWDYNVVPLHDYVNQQVRVEFVVSDCPWGGHLGYAYIDGECLDGSINIGPCLADGTRTLIAPDFFKSFQWSGNGIIGDNSKNQINVNEAGKYRVLLYTASRCFRKEIINVQPPCPQPNNDPPCQVTATIGSVGTCNQNDNLYAISLNLNLTGVSDQSVIKITDGKTEKFVFGPFTPTIAVQLPNLTSDGLMHTVKIQIFKTRFITDAMAHCETSLNYTAPLACWVPILDCSNCIGSFAPIPGEKYVLAAWVKDASATPVTATYTNPYLELLFNTSGGSVSSGQILAAGKVIEGWQRVYYEFTIPTTATSITLKLGSNSGDSYFDDIRIYPVNGSMKSYVYDPISLKLVAVLDENNYSTLYEYDQEGALIRTKKETERGVVTISENRQNNPKK